MDMLALCFLELTKGISTPQQIGGPVARYQSFFNLTFVVVAILSLCGLFASFLAIGLLRNTNFALYWAAVELLIGPMGIVLALSNPTLFSVDRKSVV